MTPKRYRITIPKLVKLAIQKQSDYIATEQQDPFIAEQWLIGVIKTIESLSEFPERCSLSAENICLPNDSKFVLRQISYKKTFRIIFTVTKGEVRILSVRHGARFK